jgi:hypothetical protein
VAKKHSNLKRDKAVLAYVMRLAATLGLDGWTIGIAAVPAVDDAFATIKPTPGQRHAVLSLCPEFVDLGHQQIRETLIHELLHLCHRDLTEVLIDTDDISLLSRQSYALLCQAQDRAAELMVDQLTRAIALMIHDDKPDLNRITKKKKRSAD